MLPYYFLDMTLLFEILFYTEEALCIKGCPPIASVCSPWFPGLQTFFPSK